MSAEPLLRAKIFAVITGRLMMKNAERGIANAVSFENAVNASYTVLPR